MALNKQSGNMYGFITHTWNGIKGKCPHDCVYCYMKVFPQKDLRLDEKEFKTDLGRNNFIFVGSSTDMFADAIPHDWIKKVIDYCKKFPENLYLFQSKNPARFIKFRNELISLNCILGTTMETNRQELLNNKAPSIIERANAMANIKGFRKMITIEPIMDFDVTPFVGEIEKTNPEFVNIGADSKNHHLPEPNKFKLENLINELKRFTIIKNKENLSRILNSKS